MFANNVQYQLQQLLHVCYIAYIWEIQHDQYNDAWLVDDDGPAQPETTAFRDKCHQIWGELVT